MISQNDHAIINAITPVLQTAASTHNFSFSKLDANGQPFAQANIFLNMGTVSTSADVFSEITVYESDTITTPSSMATVIPAFGASATTDASHGWSFTTGATGAGLGGIVEFQMDLRKRKKYIGVYVLAPAASNVVTFSAIVLLSKGAESRDSASDANHYGAVYGNLCATNARGCITRIIG